MDREILFLLVKGAQRRLVAGAPTGVTLHSKSWEGAGRRHRLGTYDPILLDDGWVVLGAYDNSNLTHLETMLSACIRHELGRANKTRPLTDVESTLVERLKDQTADQNPRNFNALICAILVFRDTRFEVERESVREGIVERIDHTTLKQRYVMYRRYGLGSQKTATFQEIAVELGNKTGTSAKALHDKVMSRLWGYCYHNCIDRIR
jgi:hypothetical protein